MKTKHVVLAALIIIAITGLLQAQTYYPVLKTFSAADIKQVDRAYAISLSNANIGLVESALMIVTMIKLDMPEEEFPTIRMLVDNLADRSTVPMIRYKACLTRAVFIDPVKYREVFVDRLSQTNAFFEALTGRKAGSLLSTH